MVEHSFCPNCGFDLRDSSLDSNKPKDNQNFNPLRNEFFKSLRKTLVSSSAIIVGFLILTLFIDYIPKNDASEKALEGVFGTFFLLFLVSFLSSIYRLFKWKIKK